MAAYAGWEGVRKYSDADHVEKVKVQTRASWIAECDRTWEDSGAVSVFGRLPSSRMYLRRVSQYRESLMKHIARVSRRRAACVRTVVAIPAEVYPLAAPGVLYGL